MNIIHSLQKQIIFILKARQIIFVTTLELLSSMEQNSDKKSDIS